MTGTTKPPRKTLGLTGVTINAMALVAPGAFAWLLYESQLAGEANGLGGIWPGVCAALIAALLTAFSFGELARRYPEAGFRSAYHFAEQVFRDSQHPLSAKMGRFAKFATGWAAHLYYWPDGLLTYSFWTNPPGHGIFGFYRFPCSARYHRYNDLKYCFEYSPVDYADIFQHTGDFFSFH
jgi:amino acid transporter